MREKGKTKRLLEIPMLLEILAYNIPSLGLLLECMLAYQENSSMGELGE